MTVYSEFTWQTTGRPVSQSTCLTVSQSVSQPASQPAHSVNRTATPMTYGKLEAASSWDRTPAITKRDAHRRAGAYEVRETNGRQASRRSAQTRRTNEFHLFTLIVVASVFSVHAPGPSRHFYYRRADTTHSKDIPRFPCYTVLLQLKDVLTHHSRQLQYVFLTYIMVFPNKFWS